MNSVVTASPFVSLGLLLRALREAVAAWGGRGVLGTALTVLLYRRLGEMCSRMERMAARFQAGRLWRRGARAEAVGAREVVRVPRAAAVRVVPSEFGWLVRLASWQAAGFGSQLRAVLAHPEMVALLAAAPQAVRALRPLCRALAIEPAVLGHVAAVRVKRVRKARVRVDTGRVPVPRGVLAWVRQDRSSKG